MPRIVPLLDDHLVLHEALHVLTKLIPALLNDSLQLLDVMKL